MTDHGKLTAKDRALDALWRELAGPDVVSARPDFRFDIRFYTTHYVDVDWSNTSAEAHFENHGMPEGRLPNTYRQTLAINPDLDTQLGKVLTEGRLLAALEAGQPGAGELAFELIVLGSPIDQRISHFSAAHYLEVYQDIKAAQMTPFVHYICWGMNEGRKSLSELRNNARVGAQVYDPSLPSCLICTHEFSQTGAPMVALRIAREAALTHNVVIAGHRDGPLRDAFDKTAVLTMAIEQPHEVFDFFEHPALETLDFAILNSVECYGFAKALVAREIPFTSYIHEYIEYTTPAYKAKMIALFSDTLVFSSEPLRLSWAGLFADLGYDLSRDSSLLAQEKLVVGQVTVEEHFQSRALLSRLIGVDVGQRRIIYGAGFVQIRKGTDLFVMTAQLARKIDPDALFVWIGDGRRSDDIGFGIWLEKHLQQAGEGRPDGNLFFLPAGPYYKSLCQAADVMFASSRLDPLANVVFDAVTNGAEVVLFANSSGFDDPQYAGEPQLKRVPYGDLEAACSALLAAPLKRPRKKTPPTSPQKKDALFETLRGRLVKRMAAQSGDPIEAGLYDVSIMYRQGDEDAEMRRRERDKCAQYRRRMVWRSPEEAKMVAASQGGWPHARTQIAAQRDLATNTSIPQYCVHVHAYYVDTLEEDLSNFAAFKHARRIVVTTDAAEKADNIAEIGARTGLDFDVQVMGNQGRDILPFLKLIMGEPEAEKGEIWCHVHQKKSFSTTRTGDAWRAFLLRSLLGDADHLSSALQEIMQSGAGLVSALDPNVVGWSECRHLLDRINRKLDDPLPDHPVLFPVGNMFWTKVEVVRRMVDLIGEDYPWPNEPIANDGTIYHLIERLWPAACALTGLRSVFLDNPDIKRA